MASSFPATDAAPYAQYYFAARYLEGVERQFRGQQDLLGAESRSRGMLQSSVSHVQVFTDCLQMCCIQSIVIFFGGDQIEDVAAPPQIRYLQDPKTQAGIMASKFPEQHVVV